MCIEALLNELYLHWTVPNKLSTLRQLAEELFAEENHILSSQKLVDFNHQLSKDDEYYRNSLLFEILIGGFLNVCTFPQNREQSSRSQYLFCKECKESIKLQELFFRLTTKH